MHNTLTLCLDKRMADRQTMRKNVMMMLITTLTSKSEKSGADPEDVSRDSVGKKDDNHVGLMDEDVVAVSMMKLHSAQVAFEREVQKLKEIGKEDPLFLDKTELHSKFKQHGNPINLESKCTSWNQVEEMLKQIIEIEVQYIAMETVMMAQQRKLTSQQAETINKVIGAEIKALQLKRKTERLKETCQ